MSDNLYDLCSNSSEQRRIQALETAIRCNARVFSIADSWRLCSSKGIDYLLKRDTSLRSRHTAPSRLIGHGLDVFMNIGKA